MRVGSVGTVGEPGPYFGANPSPDEKTIAVSRVESASNRDIWLVDARSGAPRRLTFDPADDAGPTWSPDGKRIAFFSDRRGGVRELYQKAADGSGEDELLLASADFGLSPEDWSADGRFLSYNSARPGGSHDLFVLPLSSERPSTPIPFVATPAMDSASAFSPNGRYMAYHSNESGSLQVYVREITPEGRAGPGKWQVSQASKVASWPEWRSDGRELFYFRLPQIDLVAVDVVTDGPAFRAGAERILFAAPTRLPPFRVSRDGQRFLLLVSANPPEPIRVLVNWIPGDP